LSQDGNALYQQRGTTGKKFDPERKPSDVKGDSTVYRQRCGKMKHSFQSQRKYFVPAKKSERKMK
jgi:ribosomal protein L27